MKCIENIYKYKQERQSYTGAQAKILAMQFQYEAAEGKWNMNGLRRVR